MVNILFIVFAQRSTRVRRWWIIADDRISLSRSCLSICENCYVGAQEKLVNWLFQQIEYVFLGWVIGKDVTELHVREIAGPFDKKSFVILKFDEFGLLFLI